ncbi:MAG: 16S rRNA processing protein RimM [Acidobacteriota bacterium]|nr:16S rRNA processing protein RimM [Acidobacteriota bacterium]
MSTKEGPAAERLTVARVLRPHGRRGEIAAEILTDFPDRLSRLNSVYLWDGEAEARHVNVRGCRLSPPRRAGHELKRQAIFHFEGSDSISDAERLAGLEVQIPLSERLPLPGGSYYVTDLIGCAVRDSDGRALGLVRGVQFTGEGTPGTPLLVIDAAEGELLIPLAREICTRIDPEARWIEVNLPEGLRDLNR